MRRSGTRRSGTTNALCPQSTYRTLPYSFLSLSHVPLLSFSFYLSSFSSCSRRQPLHLRSVLIFGGALIYQRVYPSTTRTHPRSILHSLHPRHAHEHPTPPARARSHTVQCLSLSEKVPFLSVVPRQ